MKTKLLTVALLCLAISTAAFARRTLNYETGEFFEGEYWDHSLWPTVDNYEDGLSYFVECDIQYAIVEDSPWYPECVRWLVPGFTYSNWEGKPEVSIDGFSIMLPDGYRSVTISAVEAEYKDFNYALQPGLPTVPDSEPQRFVDIVPYEGFFPTQPFGYNGIGIYRGTYIAYVGIWPVQYDYQNSIVRAYTHLKLRVDYKQEEASAQTAPAESPAEYYTLQGIKIPTPAKGNFYIKRQGNRSTIIRF